MIDVPEQGSERRWLVSPIVIDPPPKERIETIGDFGQRQLCAMSDAHFPDRCSHGRFSPLALLPCHQRGLKPVLVQCAWGAARAKRTYLQAQFFRLKARRGAKKRAHPRGGPILPGFLHLV